MARLRLMNKDYPVLEFDYDIELHIATRIVEVTDASHAPLGLFNEHGRVNKRDLNHWWRHRAIPDSRERVERLLENLRLDSTLELAERNFDLSLSDRYWIDDACGLARECELAIVVRARPRRSPACPTPKWPYRGTCRR